MNASIDVKNNDHDSMPLKAGNLLVSAFDPPWFLFYLFS